MAYQSAVGYLYDLVVASLTADQLPIVCDFGWRPKARQLTSVQATPNASRVVWTPGDPNGAFGERGPARNPGKIPRSLATIHELVTLTISAADIVSPEDERAQYENIRQAYDWIFRAIYLSYHGQFTIAAERWLTPNTERRRGAALEVVYALDAAIVDQGLAPSAGLITPPITGAISPKLSNTTDTAIWTIPPEPEPDPEA